MYTLSLLSENVNWKQFLTSKHKMIHASFLMTLFKIIRDEIIRDEIISL